MNCLRINGEVIFPSREDAWKDYKRKYKEDIVSKISEANDMQETEISIAGKLDKWFKKEIIELGYDVEVETKRERLGVSMIEIPKHYTTISWKNEGEM